jgi:hypothetical protein
MIVTQVSAERDAPPPDERHRWTDSAANEALSVLAREQPPLPEARAAWEGVQRVANATANSLDAGVYALESELLILPSDGARIFETDTSGPPSLSVLTRNSQPVVSYMFDVFRSSDHGGAVGRMVLEELLHPSIHDGEDAPVIKTLEELFDQGFGGGYGYLDRLVPASDNTSHSIKNRPTDWPLNVVELRGYLEARVYGRLKALGAIDSRGKITTKLLQELINRASFHAVRATVIAPSSEYVPTSSLEVRTMLNPRYGIWDPHDDGDGRQQTLSKLLSERASTLATLKSIILPARRNKYKGFTSAQGPLGEHVPWLFPEEKQGVVFDSRAGQQVLKVAGVEMAGYFSRARRRHEREAAHMLRLLNRIYPQDTAHSPYRDGDPQDAEIPQS